jgi:hypothetical protein
MLEVGWVYFQITRRTNLWLNVILYDYLWFLSFTLVVIIHMF